MHSNIFHHFSWSRVFYRAKCINSFNIRITEHIINNRSRRFTWIALIPPTAANLVTYSPLKSYSLYHLLFYVRSIAKTCDFIITCLIIKHQFRIGKFESPQCQSHSFDCFCSYMLQVYISPHKFRFVYLIIKYLSAIYNEFYNLFSNGYTILKRAYKSVICFYIRASLL